MAIKASRFGWATAVLVAGMGMFVVGRWSVRSDVTEAGRNSVPVVGQVKAALPAAKQESRPRQLLAAESYLKRFGNDPEAVEVIDWREPVPYDGSRDITFSDEIMLIVSRGRNRVGSLEVARALVYLHRGEVVKVYQDDGGQEFQWRVNVAYKAPVIDPLAKSWRDAMNQPAIQTKNPIKP